MKRLNFSVVASLVILLFIMFPTGLLASQDKPASDWQKPNWDRDLALQAASRADTVAEADRLLRLARRADGHETVRALIEMTDRSDWPEPAREATLLRFVNKLRALPPFAVDPTVLEFLRGYQNRVFVAHEESRDLAIPLYPVRTTAHGLVNQWTRQQVTLDAAAILDRNPEQLLELYAETEDPNIRAGIESAIGSASPESMQVLLDSGITALKSDPGLTGLMSRVALESGNLQALSDVFVHGTGAALVELSRQASQRLPRASLDSLLQSTAERAPAATTSVLSASISKRDRDKNQGKSSLLHNQIDPVSNPAAEEERIVEWTESDGVLGLGYPVPIPVDTPLPFDGFRTYNGLHTRHQDLMASTDIVHGEVVGTTHHGREIWAYRIGDADLLTRDGLPEPATLTNGGIHAREWQTPEVVTAIMELFAEKQGDHHFYDFLLDNVNMVILPVQNVDGFLQTQRTPTQNWLYTNPEDIQNDPNPSPRDGRMRRKNLLDVDELLATKEDHLLGVDLNRNHPPLWSLNLNRSSPDNESLVYYGPAAHSEPETQALLAAGALGPTAQLRAYTDVHSFSQVFYFHRTGNRRLAENTVSAMQTMQRHNSSLPGGKFYGFNTSPTQGINEGFGMTNEWFTTSLEIPAWGVEVEPSQGQSGAPGGGANYGGLARNGHDGFILPESQIRRVREELARSFAAVYYHQAGPPSISAMRFVDVATQAVVFEAEWDPAGPGKRVLYTNQVQPLELGRDYTFWVAYDRPMRWRKDGEVDRFPGALPSSLNFTAGAFVGNSQLTNTEDNARWINLPGEAPNGYFHYEDDSFAADFNFPRDENNLGLIKGNQLINIQNFTYNMTRQALDTDPSTAISWAAGGWSGYEDNSGSESDLGGTDKNIQVMLSADTQAAPFVVEPGISAAWFDPAHDGEGFLIEIQQDNHATMYWFTFDENGEQAWYVAAGEVRGNRLIFPQLIQTSGGQFGPDYDPDSVLRTIDGSATFLFESCSTGTFVYELPDRKGRMDMLRLTRVMGANCGNYLGPPERPEEILSGSWYNPDQDGHGFIIEVLSAGGVLVYWFAYDLDGNQAWFVGAGDFEDGELVIPEVFQTRGPIFGPDFDPNDLELIPWGEMRFTLSCGTGSMSYDGTPAGYGAGSMDLERLSSLEGLTCVD